MLDHTCEQAVLCNRNCFKILCTLLNNPSKTDKQSEVLWKENCELSCLWSPCLIGQIFGCHSQPFELCKGHLNPKILQFFLIWVQCKLKVLLKSPSFFFHTRAFWHEKLHVKVYFVRHFDSAIFVVMSWVVSLPIGSQEPLRDLYKHVCCLVSYKSIFLVLTTVKRCVIGSSNDLNKTGHCAHLFLKEENIGHQWIKFVQVRCADFLQTTEHSMICGALHIAPECFKRHGMVKMGLKATRNNLIATVHWHFSWHCLKCVSRLWRAKNMKCWLRARLLVKRSQTSTAVDKLCSEMF